LHRIESKVYDSNGKSIDSDEVEVTPDSAVYALIMIRKSPNDVKIDNVTVEKGRGVTIEENWKSSRDPKTASSELKWKIEAV